MRSLPESVGLYMEGAKERNAIERRKRREAQLRRIEQSNKLIFERECAEFGANPKGSVSPSLVRTVLEKTHNRRIGDEELKRYFAQLRSKNETPL